MRYVLLLWENSDVIQAFGPFDTQAAAEAARNELMHWPALRAAGPEAWQIKPLHDAPGAGTLAPAPITLPPVIPMPYPLPLAPDRGPERWYPNVVWCESTQTTATACATTASTVTYQGIPTQRALAPRGAPSVG